MRQGRPGALGGACVTGSSECVTVASVEDTLPEIRLVRPLPGFPELTRFVLVRLDGGATGAGASGPSGASGEEDAGGVLYELRSLERAEVRFVVAVPTAFFPDYEIELDEAACADLDLQEEDDALVLVVLTVGQDTSSTTANLLAPVVLNARTRCAAQVILSGSDWPVRAAVA